ncbi:hypothetical protein ASG90_12120 [Nocardioides sp. Soil797]|nr:hypothetical protein ASG90_12120 [Nocardioides sp. Soil797]
MTQSPLSPRPVRRGGTLAALAAASLLVLTACGDNGSDDSSGDDPTPSGSSSATAESPASGSASAAPTESATSETDLPSKGTDVAVPVYYLGDSPRGTRLFREFHSLSGAAGSDRLTGSLSEALTSKPDDPDYRTPWPKGTSLGDASYADGVITVDLSPGGNDLTKRPGSTTKSDATMAVQQLVFTAQAGAAKGRKPVLFQIDGKPTGTLLGVPTTEPVANAKVLNTLSTMSISSPAEGQEVSGTFTAKGVNNGFEANMTWQLLDGDKVVADGFGTAGGWMGNKLFPWQVKVDIETLAPGDYTFKASNDDPSGGTEGSGPDVDTRTVVVR